MRILFFGDGAGGMASLDALARQNAIVGVVAHPAREGEPLGDGSLFDQASGAGLPVARFRGQDAGLLRFARDLRPDLLWIAHYDYLLPPPLLDLAPLGAVNLHPSLLPSYRGRSSVRWALLHGERETGLSAHAVDGGVDSGDVLLQRRIEIGACDDAGDVLRKLIPIYGEVSRELARSLRQGNARRSPQAPGNWPIWPLFRREDARIDWSSDSESVANQVRASARPYDGACTWLAGTPMTIWSARAGLPRGPGSIGSIWRAEGPRFFVNCGEGSLEVLDFEFADDFGRTRPPRVGDRLEPLERAA